MATKLAKSLKKKFSKMPVEMYESLTFGDLKEGDKFIVLPIPIPGDNSGQGGFKGAHHIFVKSKRVSGLCGSDGNAVRIRYGTFSMMPDLMPVIKVE